MIIQKPWLGAAQDKGLEGKRILIVGYSFYYNQGEAMHEQMVAGVVQRFIDGLDTHTFWTSIAGYFGAIDPKSFWASVGFIEYVPVAIGNEDHSFDTASPEQLVGAADRLLDTMDQQDSDIAFMFTTKGAYDFKKRMPPGSTDVQQFDVLDTYETKADQVFDDVQARRGGRSYRVILAPHPQGSDAKTMREMVRRVMAN